MFGYVELIHDKQRQRLILCSLKIISNKDTKLKKPIVLYRKKSAVAFGIFGKPVCCYGLLIFEFIG
jgi:hypothetical protein